MTGVPLQTGAHTHTRAHSKCQCFQKVLHDKSMHEIRLLRAIGTLHYWDITVHWCCLPACVAWWKGRCQTAESAWAGRCIWDFAQQHLAKVMLCPKCYQWCQ